MDSTLWVDGGDSILTGRKDGKTRRNAVKHNKEYATEVALNGLHRERFKTRL